MRGGSVSEIVRNQADDQSRLLFGTISPPVPRFTTVGIEYEFAQFDFPPDSSSPLVDATHVELGRTAEEMPFSNLPFFLETDSGNVIELVTPPFLVQTVGQRAIPNPDMLEHANNMMKSALGEIFPTTPQAPAATAGRQSSAKAKPTTPKVTSSITPAAPPPTCLFQEMLNELSGTIGWPFLLNELIRMNSSNINPRTPTATQVISSPGTAPTGEYSTSDILGEKVKASQKNGRGNISEQINFATEASVYHDLKKADAAQSFGQVLPPTPLTRAFLELENSFRELFRQHCRDTVFNAPNISMFFDEMARNFSQCVAIPASNKVEAMKKQVFDKLLHPDSPPRTRPAFVPKDLADIENMDQEALVFFGVPPKEAALFARAANIRSCVKDVHGVWLKDNLMNFAYGSLKVQSDYTHVYHMLGRLPDKIAHIPVPDVLNVQSDGYGELFQKQLNIILSFFAPYENAQPLVGTFISSPPVAFGGHNPGLPGARHDTLLDYQKVNPLTVPFPHDPWCVAEVRNNPIDRIRFVAGLDGWGGRRRRTSKK